MTKRAIAIEGFVKELTALTLDAFAINTGLQGLNPNLTPTQAYLLLTQTQLNLKAYLVDMLENNSEQAEALMAELNVKWQDPPPPLE